jgi:hypothetical protein
MALRNVALALLAGTSMCACTGFPTYKAPPAGPDTATIDVSRINASTLCTNGHFFTIGPVKDGQLVVPATGRTAVYSWVSIAEYQVTYTCMPGVSFQPDAGQSYLLNLEVDGKACRLEIYQKGAPNRIGLDLVRSAAPAKYCQ